MAYSVWVEFLWCDSKPRAPREWQATASGKGGDLVRSAEGVHPKGNGRPNDDLFPKPSFQSCVWSVVSRRGGVLAQGRLMMFGERGSVCCCLQATSSRRLPLVPLVLRRPRDGGERRRRGGGGLAAEEEDGEGVREG